eukprot:10751120-Alexandrium_andersonii.AAC.1
MEEFVYRARYSGKQRMRCSPNARHCEGWPDRPPRGLGRVKTGATRAPVEWATWPVRRGRTATSSSGPLGRHETRVSL